MHIHDSDFMWNMMLEKRLRTVTAHIPKPFTHYLKCKFRISVSIPAENKSISMHKVTNSKRLAMRFGLKQCCNAFSMKKNHKQKKTHTHSEPSHTHTHMMWRCIRWSKRRRHRESDQSWWPRRPQIVEVGSRRQIQYRGKRAEAATAAGYSSQSKTESRVHISPVKTIPRTGVGKRWCQDSVLLVSLHRPQMPNANPIQEFYLFLVGTDLACTLCGRRCRPPFGAHGSDHRHRSEAGPPDWARENAAATQGQ